MTGHARFAWALSFLDLFTCALGGVFVLVLITSRDREEAAVLEPGRFVFVTVKFADADADAAAAAVEEAGGFISAPSPPAGNLRVIALTRGFKADPETLGAEVRITLTARPASIRVCTEAGCRDDGPPPAQDPLLVDGTGYRVKITCPPAPPPKPAGGTR